MVVIDANGRNYVFGYGRFSLFTHCPGSVLCEGNLYVLVFDQPYLGDRSVEVPFKIDKGILTQAKEENSLWQTLAGCLVGGVLNQYQQNSANERYRSGQSQSNVDATTGAVLGGVVQGVFGQNNNCYGGVGSTSRYGSGSSGVQGSGTYNQSTQVYNDGL